MESRNVIGQAQGILMQRHGLTADAAFALLRRQSQQTNVKLVVLARQIGRQPDVVPGIAVEPRTMANAPDRRPVS